MANAVTFLRSKPQESGAYSQTWRTCFVVDLRGTHKPFEGGGIWFNRGLDCRSSLEGKAARKTYKDFLHTKAYSAHGLILTPIVVPLDFRSTAAYSLYCGNRIN